MSQKKPRVTIELDFSRHGKAKTVRTRLFPQERRDLHVGDEVLLSGDSVEPRPFQVSAISPDGREFTFERR